VRIIRLDEGEKVASFTAMKSEEKVVEEKENK
jgi:hypothetical protein